MHSKEARVNTNPSSINQYIAQSLSKHTYINAQYRIMKYEMKQIWIWKQVEIILWKEQRDRGRKEISEERRREEKESDNDMTYKEMISIRWNIGKR